MLLFHVIPIEDDPLFSSTLLIEVSARIPDIVCIAQTTLVMVNNVLLVNNRQLLFFRFDLVSDLTARIHGANINSNSSA